MLHSMGAGPLASVPFMLWRIRAENSTPAQVISSNLESRKPSILPLRSNLWRETPFFTGIYTYLYVRTTELSVPEGVETILSLVSIPTVDTPGIM